MLSSVYWQKALVYLMLRSCLIAPNRMIVWASAAVSAAAFIWAVGRLFGPALKLGKDQRAANKRARLTNEPVVVDTDILARRLRFQRRAPWDMVGIMASFLWLLSCLIALVLWDPGSASMGLVRDHGKMRYTTQREDLQRTLHWLERDGIFTPLSK